jgi:hypothetical protein
MFEKKDFDMAITTIYRVYTEARNRSGIVPSSVVPADQSYASVPLSSGITSMPTGPTVPSIMPWSIRMLGTKR